MLKQRIITALWLIPLVIGGFFYTAQLVFFAFIGVITVLAAWEWANLAGIKSQGKRVLYAFVVGLIFIFPFIYGVIFSLGFLQSFTIDFAITSFFWWLFAIYLVIKFPIYFKQWAMLIIGILILLPCAFSLIILRNYTLLLVLLGVVCLADTGAYFAGKKFGKHKLAVKVSPGKTIEGVIGGFLASFIFMLACYGWLVFNSDFMRFIAAQNANINVEFFHGINLLLISIFSVVLVLASVLGDLTESMFKRLIGVKDSSNLLPGHGGILDRIDGYTCAAPIFYLGLMLCQDTLLVRYFVWYGYG